MFKKILIVTILIVTFISLSNGETINLEYTDGFKSINRTLYEDSYINIPSGNIIDSISYKPVFLAGNPGSYNIKQEYYINDALYEDTFDSELETSIFHIFTNKYTYNIRHELNDELQYQKEYETYISKYCWFPIKIDSYFGSHANEDENKITIESEIFGHTGIKRSSDTFSTYGAKAFASSNYTISYTGFSDLDVIITYKVLGLHTTEYYVGQLNPTLKNMYKLGFSWMDKELYILNIFIITDKLISILMFWMSILANSFVPITFIVLTFVIPICAFYNSKNRQSFIYNLSTYYGKLFSIVFGFIRYIIMMIMRVLEIARSLIPWIWESLNTLFSFLNERFISFENYIILVKYYEFNK